MATSRAALLRLLGQDDPVTPPGEEENPFAMRRPLPNSGISGLGPGGTGAVVNPVPAGDTPPVETTSPADYRPSMLDERTGRGRPRPLPDTNYTGGYTPPDMAWLTDQYRQRGTFDPGLMGHPTLQGAATGASYGSAAGPIGAGIGAGVGALAGYFKGRHADSDATDYLVDDARDMLHRAAQEYLGRDISDKDVEQMIRGQGWKPGDQYVGSFGMNEMLKAMAINGHLEQQTKAAGAAATPPPAAAPPPTPPPTPTTSARTTPYGQVAGFETSRLNDPNDTSGKYVLARWMLDHTQDGQQPVTGALVRQFIAEHPQWELRGSDADPQIRQKQSYLDTTDPGRQSFWQDVIRDAGGAGGLQFTNAEDTATPGPGRGSAPAGTSGVDVASQYLGQLSQGDILARIQEEIAALLAGQPSPLTQSSIIQQLGGGR